MRRFAPDWLLWPNAWWIPRQAGNGPCPSMNGQTYTLAANSINRGMLDGSINRRSVREVEPMIEAGLWWNWY